MNYVMGVDIGTQSTKALLVDGQGTIIAQHSQGYRVDTPKVRWAEQWPQVWLDAVEACVAHCMAKAGVAAEQVKALCISSLYGGSGIAVDAHITPLHPCLIWMDRRASEQVAWVREQVDLERLFAITGNSVDSYYGFTKMLWLKQHQPEVWAKTRYLLPPNSYINWCLTGALAVDHSSAGNIGGVYDVKARGWSGEMLDALGIPQAMMPERLVYSGEVVGGLLEGWAERLGLQAGTPILAGGVDAAMATLAAGVTQPGNHVAMIGTSMCWGYLNQQVDAHHGLVSMPHVYNGHRDLYIFGGAITAGASVSWFREQFCQAEEQQAKATGQDSLVLLEQRAMSIPAGSEGLLFLPYLMGERSPVWDDRASGSFVGLNLYHSRIHLYRAVLEGVSFALRHNIEAGTRGAHSLDPRLIVVGGASHSDLWMQIIADVTRYPVYTIVQEVEAALGAALLAAHTVGLVSDGEMDQGWVQLELRAEPKAENVEAYDRAFAEYLKLYPALKPIMHSLQEN
ncbi:MULTISPECIES: FGGY-family carbohydrate kinase [Pseudomonas]|uniref:Actin n=1 Tax=Pseudomonas fluorescens LMG 5329 TaxID=1324332 RepID=A0A0A1YXN1_PSEFL|nr:MULTISPECIES: FGGY-family carbohydrate kinase [Pseudomonas]KGE65729.1 actin [Pseudomonas fluorescens LMG 5329]NWE01703.1 FGGY-family carbohydrate kinase [Pseudomonas sp. IPO3749]NWF23323.1 FGGY-family carbohydrate kinase [Pseudomonas sp. IPO3749]